MKYLLILLMCVLTLIIIPFKGEAQQMKRTANGWEQVSQPSTKDSIDTKEYYTYKGKDYKIWLSSRGSAYAWIPKTKSQGMRKFYLGKDKNVYYQEKMKFNAKRASNGK